MKQTTPGSNSHIRLGENPKLASQTKRDYLELLLKVTSRETSGCGEIVTWIWSTRSNQSNYPGQLH